MKHTLCCRAKVALGVDENGLDALAFCSFDVSAAAESTNDPKIGNKRGAKAVAARLRTRRMITDILPGSRLLRLSQEQRPGANEGALTVGKIRQTRGDPATRPTQRD